MKRWLYLLVALVSSCVNPDPDNKKIAADEIHRPADYSSDIQLTLSKDTFQNEFEHHDITSFSSEKDFESLVDQLWLLAFSGDAIVRPRNAFGEIDRERSLNPDELLKEVKKLDTIRIEDLLTGQQKDSVIDVSFDKNQVSALSVYFKAGLDNQSQLQINPYSVGFGKQVFVESTGEYRGTANQFFIEFSQTELDEVTCNQRLCIRSDSTGILKPSYFDFYYEDGGTPFESLMTSASLSDDLGLYLNAKIELHFSKNQMLITPIKRERQS